MNKLIKTLLLGKFVSITNANGVITGVVKSFHKHIDGGIVLENAYKIEKDMYYSSVIAAKLCIPEFGMGNYTTSIIIEDDKIVLYHSSNNDALDKNNPVVKEIIKVYSN